MDEGVRGSTERPTLTAERPGAGSVTSPASRMGVSSGRQWGVWGLRGCCASQPWPRPLRPGYARGMAYRHHPWGSYVQGRLRGGGVEEGGPATRGPPIRGSSQGGGRASWRPDLHLHCRKTRHTAAENCYARQADMNSTARRTDRVVLETHRTVRRGRAGFTRSEEQGMNRRPRSFDALPTPGPDWGWD